MNGINEPATKTPDRVSGGDGSGVDGGAWVVGVDRVGGVEGGPVDLDLDPSLARWVALTGATICAALFLSLPLLQLVSR